MPLSARSPMEQRSAGGVDEPGNQRAVGQVVADLYASQPRAASGILIRRWNAMRSHAIRARADRALISLEASPAGGNR